ncbi:hypothetical protein SAMD00019534_012920 [Acytostelium subglobosum LB1]|uniref:hypothetical protein n=1 Tax=Acytostelium subglobosum LB1 TaxID=1410327 RepID=UPI000644D9DD|nr:hypothetical protein SAMD00019534_012920 [Acytostelium subglobosum LB1]GAM18117.1 hypothetical protein SAMD00019534_012920 [Acytostelium subglobosum LB1]|eukprot:XP_012758713.1 hypothetical protein SAMD00019534_012920 [Acytostelium subglobosum LB1]
MPENDLMRDKCLNWCEHVSRPHCVLKNIRTMSIALESRAMDYFSRPSRFKQCWTYYSNRVFDETLSSLETLNLFINDGEADNSFDNITCKILGQCTKLREFCVVVATSSYPLNYVFDNLLAYNDGFIPILAPTIRFILKDDLPNVLLRSATSRLIMRHQATLKTLYFNDISISISTGDDHSNALTLRTNKMVGPHSINMTQDDLLTPDSTKMRSLFNHSNNDDDDDDDYYDYYDSDNSDQSIDSDYELDELGKSFHPVIKYTKPILEVNLPTKLSWLDQHLKERKRFFKSKRRLYIFE